MIKKKVKWWNLPQAILDKAVEDGIEYTKVEWYVEVDDKGNRRYGVEQK